MRQKGYTSFTPLGKVLPVIRREVEGGKGDQIAPVLRKLGEASRVLEVPVERTDGGSRQDGRGRDKARPRKIRVRLLAPNCSTAFFNLNTVQCASFTWTILFISPCRDKFLLHYQPEHTGEHAAYDILYGDAGCLRVMFGSTASF